jgi:hypothetical protein
MYLTARDADISFILFNRDPLFWVSLRVLNILNLPYPSINILSSLLFFIGINALAKRQQNPLVFLVLIFPILIINMPMSAIRQAAAIGMICLAILAIIDKRPKHFLLCVFLATGFHISAVAFLVLFPFTSGKYNYSRILISGVIMVFILYVIKNTTSGQHTSDMYIGTDREAYGAIYRIGMLTLSGIFFFLILQKKWKKHFPEDYGIVVLGALGMIMLLFLVPISTIITDRYGYYLIPLQIMIFARIPYLQFYFKRNHIIYSSLPYLSLIFVLIIWTLTSWHFNKCYVPYKNLIFDLSMSYIS